MADGDVETATRPRTTGETVYLPPLPESQIQRPPTQEGVRRDQTPGAEITDEYFVLPRIEGASRVAEDSLQQLRPAVALRAPGAKASKTVDDPDSRFDATSGQFRDSRQRDSAADKSAGADAGSANEDRTSNDSAFTQRDRQESLARGHDGTAEIYPPSSRSNEVGAERRVHARRGPLPSQRRQATANSQEAPGVGTHGRLRTGATSAVGKAPSTAGSGGRTDILAVEGGLVEDVTEQSVEERLERIRSSNIRRDFRQDAGGGKEGGSRRGNNSESDVIQGIRATSPRRPRPAEHEYGRKAGFAERPPEMSVDRARRQGALGESEEEGGGVSWVRGGKGRGEDEGVEEVELVEVRQHLRQTLLRFVDKPAPDMESKPPPALSVEAGAAPKNKDVVSAVHDGGGSDEMPRGRHGEGRRTWYGSEGDRGEPARVPSRGAGAGADTCEVRLQAAVGHGGDVGFERTLAQLAARSKGRALEDKDLSRDNVHVPSGGYVPSIPDKTRHAGSDGTRAQARAEVAVAAPVKLPRQEGFMVQRDKDEGLSPRRASAIRAEASREQAVTSLDDVTEEAATAAKLRRLVDGPGKLEDTDYETLDGRASQLTGKVRERRGHYAVPKDPGADEQRDARPIPHELQLKPPGFMRRKGSGEDKMRSAYY